MGRYRGPKNKRSRRIGMDIYGTGGESLERRINQPPGAHGREQQFRRRRESEYARQLREKQKVKWMYGVRENQFRRFFRMAQRSQEQTGIALLKILERRLDNVIYRMGLARTRPQARQTVTHGHILVDGRRVNIPSYLVEPGQEIALKPKAAKMPHVEELVEARPPVPEWLDVEETQARVLREPERQEIDADINEQLIVEYYSR
ncbi:MAG: 30S ribosomal protein S4 [Anaerolineales bacterium]